jgi:hypothetical protein
VVASISKRIRGNDILSATLIELLLVISFVLLLVLFLDDSKKVNALQKQETCIQLVNALRLMVGPQGVAEINCDDYSTNFSQINKKIIAAAMQIDEVRRPLFPSGGVTTRFEPSVYQLLKELGSLRMKHADLHANSQWLEQRVSQLEAQIQGLGAIPVLPGDQGNRASGLAGGSGLAPCLTSEPNSANPEHDFLLEIDLTKEDILVRLRQDEKHRNKIELLMDRGVLAKFVTKDGFIAIREQEFLATFSALLNSSQNSNPVCRYQARVLIDDEVTKKRAMIVEEVFYTETKMINKK